MVTAIAGAFVTQLSHELDDVTQNAPTQLVNYSGLMEPYTWAMESEAFDSARAKLDRAGVHMNDLMAQMYDFFSQEPQMVTSVPGLDGRAQLMMRLPMPADWSTLIGDCIQNMRAALDHAALEVVLANDPSAKPSSTQFPIADNEREWFGKKGDNGQCRWIKDASPAAKDFFLEVQPHQSNPGEEKRDPLYVLNDLARIDRHRAVHLLIAATRGRYVGLDPMPRRGNAPIAPGDKGPFWFVADTQIDHGSIRISNEQLSDEPVESFSHQGFGVFFDLGEEGHPSFEVVDTLNSIGAYVGNGVLPRLAAFV